MTEIVVHEGLLEIEEQRQLHHFLNQPGWWFGAISTTQTADYRYWRKHFVGITNELDKNQNPATFEAELLQSAPLASKLWTKAKAKLPLGHRMMRCYANGNPFGAEASIHTDIGENTPGRYSTLLYYPHLAWHPDWGGETLFFNAARDDLIAAIYPKPGRLVIFNSAIPHVARPVTRKCPELRITLMFKTQQDTSE